MKAPASARLPARKLGKSARQDIEAARVQQRLHDADEAVRRYQKLVTRVALEQRIINDFATWLATERLTVKVTAPSPPYRNKRKTAEAAVLVISDSHVWKVVHPDHTLGFGCYNPKIFLDRLYHLEATVARLITQNIDNPIDELHVEFLGDLVEGILDHAQELPQRGYVVDQVMLASLAFYQFLARLSRVVPRMYVRGVTGNHGRWPNQRKMPSEGRFSNYDFIVLGQMQSLLMHAGPRNVRFHLEEAPFQVFSIKGWKFKIGHGDHLKGGDRALGIPAHAIGREVNATTQRYNARGERAPDYYLVGDKHRHMSLQTARGRYMVNGAWFEADDFAMRENFTPGRPFQLFFGVHPRFGKSWQYEIALDAATPVPIQYELPVRLQEKIAAFI